MKVLVTGATGFIGNYVINELLSRNSSIVASSRSVIKAARASWYNKVAYVPYDIGSSFNGSLMDHFGHPDKLIHLAWQGLPNYKQLFHFEKELPLQYRFLKQLAEEGLRDITVTGTCFEYGMQEGKLSEEMSTIPANPYAFAKDTLRKQLKFLNEELNFNLKWLRLFYMYGTGQSPSSVLSQLQQALDDQLPEFNMSKGDQIRDYLPVEEVARNIAAVALQSDITGIINCSSGTPITIMQLVQHYLHKTKAAISLNPGYYPYPDYEPFAFWGDHSKLKKIL